MSFNSASPRLKRGMPNRGGPGRGRVKPNSSSGSQQGPSLDGLYSNDRLVNAVTSVLGCPAKVTGKSGKQFEGIFKTLSPEASLVLGKANQVDEQRQNGVVKSDFFDQFVIHRKDWVKAEFQNVNLEECVYKKDYFKTDTATLGGKRMNGQKELEKWTGADNSDSLETSSLESHTVEINGIGWSPEKMFDVNEKKYGVKSTYNEDMEEYTTKLEKSDTPEYREKEKFAAQKAEEICKESPFERNMFDGGRSEEQLYSAVVRNRADKSLNWRQSHSDRPPEREQRDPRQDDSGSPVSNRKEPPTETRIQQVDGTPVVQVKEKIGNPSTELRLESKSEHKVEAFSDVVKAGANHVNSSKPLAKTPETQVLSKETQKNPNPEPFKTKKDEQVEDFKNFSRNFQLPEGKKKAREKKVSEEEEKASAETTSEEKIEEVETPQEGKESEGDKKASALNPNAQEFRPRAAKRNTPSPRSNASSNGTPSPFQNSSPFSPSGVSPYPPNNIYRPRGRGGMRPEFMEHAAAGFVNASNAAGQPFFAHIPQFLPQHTPPGIPYMQPPGNLRHPGIQHPVYIQQHHQPGHMMVPMGQMGPGPYQDNAIYYSTMPMMQSPPQITSPSLQQQQFNFPSPALHQNQVRPVTQPPVMSQQPAAPYVLVRQPNPGNDMQTTPLQPTQIMNRPPQGQAFQGN